MRPGPSCRRFSVQLYFHATEFFISGNFSFEVGWGGAAASPLSNILTGRPSPVSMLKSESQILDKRSASPSEPHQSTDLGPQLMTLKAYSGSCSSSHRYGKQLLLLCQTLNQFSLCKLALKSTYSNVEFQKFSGGNPRTPTSIDPPLCCHTVQVSMFCLQLALQCMF